MITEISQSGKTNYGITSFVLDKQTDVENLPTEDIIAGSTAFVIENSKAYMMNSSGEWKEI